MSSLTLGFFLLALSASALCLTDESEEFDLPIDLDSDNNELQLPGFSLFDVLKKLNICYVKCKENYCECCQKIKILIVKINVCATADVTPAKKIANVGIKAAGLPVETHLCRNVTSEIGPLRLCVDTTVLENSSFPVCFKLQVSYEGIPTALLNFGCPSTNVTINEGVSGEYHSLATLNVLNGDQAAKAVQKIFASGIATGSEE